MITGTVTGNVGRKPEMRTTGGGKQMASFSVASTVKREGREPQTTWVDVVCFDEQAERVVAELDKGARVVVSGRIALETYEKKNGEAGSTLRMVADEVGVSLRWGRKERAGAGADDDYPVNF